jgi:integrase
LGDIRRIIEAVKEPTKSMLALMAFASMRPGELLTLRRNDILRDRIVFDERVYDDEFDEVKTVAGDREVPFDRHGMILAAVKRMWARNTRFRKPEDLVYANRAARPLDRHNLLHRHLKPVAETMTAGRKRSRLRSWRAET